MKLKPSNNGPGFTTYMFLYTAISAFTVYIYVFVYTFNVFFTKSPGTPCLM